MHLEGTFSPDGTSLGGAWFGGLVNTSELAPLLDLGSVDEPDIICEYISAFGLSCENCGDGTPYCIYVEAHFGEDKEFPYAIDEPGIGGVAADVGLALGDNILLSLASGISVWNGSGFSSSSTEMTVGFGPNTVSSKNGGDLSFTVTEDYDYHPIFSIAETSAVGSYLLQFSVSVDGLTSSDPFWIVFNQGMDDELYEESVEWVEGNLVPAPGAIGLLAMAGLASSRRRRN